jgi:predicted membrane protein
METQKENQNDDVFCTYEKEHKRGKIIGGILVILAGSLLMARELGAEIPYWVFTWKTFLIGLGIIIGIKHNFRNHIWIILVLVGGAYLVTDLYPELAIKHLLLPFLVIMFGLMMVFRPKRRFRNRMRHRDWKKWHEEHRAHRRDYNYNYGTESSTDDTVESVTFMGGVKKKITSKSFKNGEIVVIFGGAEIDFSQADINEQATLEIVQVFGGTKLIVPANWEIKSELVSIFGSIEDKRMMQPTTLTNEPKKVLILRGTTIFGGTDIKSF